MRRITLIVSLFALSASGQTFSFIGDSVQPSIASHGTTVKLVNNTNDTVTIDSIFFFFLPQPPEPPAASPRINQINFGISSIDTPEGGGGYFFYGSWLKTDSLYVATSYYATGVKPLVIKANDTMLLKGLQGFASTGQLMPNDTNRYALIIFKSGTTSDTLTLMGYSAAMHARISSDGHKASGKPVLNIPAPLETYTILGQRVAPADQYRKNQLLIIKRGSAIKYKFF